MSGPGPSYNSQGAPYSPYHAPNGSDLSSPGYPPPGSGWRPEWNGSYGHQGLPSYGAHPSPGHAYPNPTSPTSATSRSVDRSRRKRNSHDQQHTLSHQQQVYSFVPIPGAQQHKRPRRRYEEIERMYKCGWNGCEKAYGTLNHLNAHVTMQSHGQKRTPEEFKEIRKEWKARKKEEEAAARKAEETQQRHSRQLDGSLANSSQSSGQYGVTSPRQLPPLSYQQQGGHYTQSQPGMDSMQQYQSTSPMYPAYSHNSPYGHAQGQPMYQPRQTPMHPGGGEENDADAETDPDVPAASYSHTQ